MISAELWLMAFHQREQELAACADEARRARAIARATRRADRSALLAARWGGGVGQVRGRAARRTADVACC